MTELYNLHRGDRFKLLEEPTVPPVALGGDMRKVYKLTNIDGMYSHITDDDGNVYHFAAWTDVEKV